MKLVIDMDGVCCQFIEAVCKEVGMEVSKIDTWDLGSFGIDEDVWAKPGFFRTLKPVEGCIEVMEELDKEHDLIIATDHLGIDFIKKDKREWLQEYLPFIDEVHFGRDKSIITGDLLFDDAPHHLNEWGGIKVKMVTPYNRHVLAHYTVENWYEFFYIVNGG